MSVLDFLQTVITYNTVESSNRVSSLTMFLSWMTEKSLIFELGHRKCFREKRERGWESTQKGHVWRERHKGW